MPVVGQRERARSSLRRWQPWGIVACLGGSALALALAPLLMPDAYSWVSHTTSESAAQGVSGAWLARLGFLMFGLAVLWLTALAGARWERWGRLFQAMFGVLMTATAAFSHRPFEPDVVFDRQRTYSTRRPQPPWGSPSPSALSLSWPTDQDD